MEQRLRASPEQFAVILEYMERHGDILKVQPGIRWRVRSDRLWKELALTLNSVHGGVKKPLEKWKKVWADWKSKTKKKYFDRQQVHGADGGVHKQPILTDLEERVISVMGVATVTSQDSTEEQSLNRLSTPVKQEGNGHDITIEVPLSQDNTQEMATLSAPLQRQVSSPISTLHRKLLRTRRIKGRTPIERAANEFAAIERLRLKREEIQDRRFHRREMARIRLDAKRIDVDREHNQLLSQLCFLGQHLIDLLTRTE